MQFFRNYFAFLVLFISSFCLTSCATILHGTRQKVEVTSNPPGAIITDGLHCWIAPAEIVLTRKEDHRLFIWKPGYNMTSVQLKHTVGPAVIGNMLFPGGFIGVCIDLSDGAEFKLVPAKIDVTLQPISKNKWFFDNKSN